VTDSPLKPLHVLAGAHGVAVEFWDWKGTHRTMTDETIRTVLTALGVSATDDAAVAESLGQLDLAPWRRTLPPVVVTREGHSPWVHVHVPDGERVHVWIELEQGGPGRNAWPVDHWVEPREVDGVRTGRATVQVPSDLPLGWHRIHAEIGDGRHETTVLVVTPSRLQLPPALQERRRWGLMTQRYPVRSDRSGGVADLADHAEIASWGAELGADFVLVNPLHAAEPVAPMEPSPYLPTTRRFANPVYLRVEEVPEAAYLDAGSRARVDALAARAHALDTEDVIDRDAAWALKDEALRILFAAEPTSGRARAFAAFRAAQGEGLERFATWSAIAVAHGATGASWPAGLDDPTSPEVAEFASENADEVTYHCWLQWLLDEAQARTQRAALDAGMRLGVVTDLAVGVHPEGADAWALRDVLASGVTVGAPPDQFNQLGQNWHQPPWHPGRLAEAGYAPFRDMVRAVLKDSGGIRVDHVIGLFRLWWVPEGRTAAEGTYVRYDHEAMVGILCLEAARAVAFVVGEDLGVVEPSAREFLLERGVLGSSILWFEWTPDGRPLPPEDYRELCLASVTTHDLPPTAGYLDLAHVELRAELGLLTRSVAEESAVEHEAIDRVTGALADRGFLAPGADRDEVLVGLHRWITATPSRLLGVALSDLVGDKRIINQPGTEDEYPNWRVPLTDTTGRLLGLEGAQRVPLAGRIAAVLPRG
jgi:4-alpha-glucanotransferase